MDTTAPIHPTAQIHPTAIIEEGAHIGPHCVIGAYTYIGAEVSLGESCEVRHHATVEGWVLMGSNNIVFPYAYIGGKTHDLKFKGGRTGLRIGDNNEFREYTTIHPATSEGDFTLIGDHNHLLAYSHIAHDCILGNHIVMSGHCALAGHVIVGDHAVIAWGCGIHQFCRVGSYGMASACSKNVKDIPPYMIAEGSPAEVRAINKIGLARHGFSTETITEIGRAYRFLYHEGLNRTQALEKIQALPGFSQKRELQILVKFYKTSKRGVA
ncbi:MAG: acyl-ACP--UDP-N-acetylglucosamine O-acyltransferase [Puniceicoccales bacterium]|jgi:UDP-N-acetylglucosamine acyltransferase|nr:acyl-ACP--UDP-N-acetylglucosamine O-acyltransferase [Puniceicoccales bacterium]